MDILCGMWEEDVGQEEEGQMRQFPAIVCVVVCVCVSGEKQDNNKKRASALCSLCSLLSASYDSVPF